MNTSVAIIEDDGPIREILGDWLSRTAGYECVGSYDSAESALAGIPQVLPQIVLADINLPGLSGIEAVRTLKLQLPATHFVMLTVYEDADHIFDALAAGAVGYLLKRTPLDELLAALQEVQSGGSPMSSNIARKVVQSFQRPQTNTTDEKLSPREREVLDKLAGGFLYKEIADAMGLSLPTVNTYVRRIYEKLHVHSRSQAIARYVQGRPS